MVKRLFTLIDDGIGTIALIGIILLTGANVFLRYIVNQPITWLEEVAIGLFIWLVFIGISSAMRRNGHIGVDYFVKKMPRPLKLISHIIRAVAIYYVLIYVFIYLGFDLTSQAVNKVTPILGISYSLIDLAVPIGGILTTIHFTKTFIDSFQNDFLKGGE